jgi:hypothetical protein
VVVARGGVVVVVCCSVVVVTTVGQLVPAQASQQLATSRTHADPPF